MRSLNDSGVSIVLCGACRTRSESLQDGVGITFNPSSHNVQHHSNYLDVLLPLWLNKIILCKAYRVDYLTTTMQLYILYI